MTHTPAPSTASDSKASSLHILKKKAGHAFSFVHGHKASEGHPSLLQPPPAQHVKFDPAHRRNVSMPDPSRLSRMPDARHSPSTSSGSSIDERTFGSASPPIFDFTTFEDRYRHSGPTGLHNGFLAVTPSSSSGRRAVSDNLTRYRRTTSEDSDNVSSPTNRSNHDLIIATVEDILAEDSVHWSYDVDGLIEAKKGQEKEEGSSVPLQALTNKTVFGQPLAQVVGYASRTVYLGTGRSGTAHELPLVIVSCIEELYKTGIFQHNLFRTLPNRKRLLDLISLFDSRNRSSDIKCSTPRPGQTTAVSNAEYGADLSLQLETTSDICALFTSYLSALPDSLVPARIFEAIWVLCDMGTSHPLTKAPSSEADVSRAGLTILLAQLLLQLLPAPKFSLLVYLLCFFSQAVLVHEENGVDIRDLAKMFGVRLFGSGTPRKESDARSKNDSRKQELDPVSRGEVMMAWFLRRWPSIFDTLFDVIEDAKMGVYRRNKRLRKDSLGRPALQRRRERTVKNSVQPVDGEDDADATPKARTMATSHVRKTSAPAEMQSLATFRFPISRTHVIREPSQFDGEVSPTTVVTPPEERYRSTRDFDSDVGRDASQIFSQTMQRLQSLQGVPLAPARSKSEPGGSAVFDPYYQCYDSSSDYDAPRRASDPPDQGSMRGRPSCGLSLPSIRQRSMSQSAMQGASDSRTHPLRPRGCVHFDDDDDNSDMFANDERNAADTNRYSTMLEATPDSLALLDDLLLEMTMPTFPNSPILGYAETTAPLSTPKLKQTNLHYPSVVESSPRKPITKKSAIPTPRSGLPLRRAQSKTGVAPLQNLREQGLDKDEAIRQLLSKVERLEKERDEALHVLGEVQKMLGNGK